MPNPWFRCYSELATDPKVQMMPEAMRWRLISIMCLRCSETLETLQETELAFLLRISVTELAETKLMFIARGFIDEDWKLLNWDKRQYASDSSTERVRAFRERKKSVTLFDEIDEKRFRNVIEADTESDTEQNLSDATHPHPDDSGKMHPHEAIYQAYPRKEGHGTAVKAIEKAVAKLVKGKDTARCGPMSRRQAQVLLFRAVTAYARSPVGMQADRTKIPHPATWFNQERWGDDQGLWKQISNMERVNGKADRSIDVAAKLVNEFENYHGAHGGQLLPGGGIN